MHFAVYIIILVLALSFAAATAVIAGRKGYIMWPFYLLGLVLGPLGLLVFLLPRKEPDASRSHDIPDAGL